MLAWLSENYATLIVAVLLAAAVGGAVAVMIRNRKKGKSSCGCGCPGCTGSCRKKDEK